MKRPIHEFWGCGRGVVKKLNPWVRLVVIFLLCIACIIAPVNFISGSVFVFGILVLWFFLCFPPVRVILIFGGLGLGMFLPYFLLIPVMWYESGGRAGDFLRAFEVSWSILCRGMGIMLVCAGGVTAMTVSDLREGLVRLPVLNFFSEIILQIIKQSMVLIGEVGRISSAIAFRGATRGGKYALKVLFSMPEAWFPRLLMRAERTAEAMEVRGYCERNSIDIEGEGTRLIDYIALFLTILVLLSSLLMRFYWTKGLKNG